jgi:STIP1 family protein 1
MAFSIENLDFLMCPITTELFIEPVIGSDCHTYEHKAIIVWLQEKKTSPITREPMSVDSLRSNLTVKKIIEDLSKLSKKQKE